MPPSRCTSSCIALLTSLVVLRFVVSLGDVVVDLPQTYRHINFAFLCVHLYIMIVLPVELTTNCALSSLTGL